MLRNYSKLTTFALHKIKKNINSRWRDLWRMNTTKFICYAAFAHVFLFGWEKVEDFYRDLCLMGLWHKMFWPFLSSSILSRYLLSILYADGFKIILLYQTMWSRCLDVVVEGHIIELGEPLGSRKKNGERRGRGEVSIQATWNQSGRESHHTQRRDSK